MPRRMILAVIAALAVTLVVPITPAGSASAANPDLFTLSSDADDFLLRGASYSFPDFTVTGNRSSVQITHTDGVGTMWRVTMGAQPGGTLTAGFYEDAIRSPFPSVDAPTLKFTFATRDCSTSSGRFVIDEITFLPDDAVASLVAHWEQHCEGLPAASFGTVSWNGTTALSPMDAVAPGTFADRSIDTVSASKPQVLSNPGGTPVAVTSVQVTGRDAAQFVITDDPCSGTSIPAGGTCTVQLAFAPIQVGMSLASLTVVDDLHPSGTSTPLRGRSSVRVGTVWNQSEASQFGTPDPYLHSAVTSVAGTPTSGVVNVTSADSSTTMAAADGAPLVAGSYEGAVRYPFAVAGTPMFDQTIKSSGCNTLSARFVVQEIAWGTNGTLARLVAHWETHCDGGPVGTFGGVNYNGTVPFVERYVDPFAQDFGVVTVGTAISRTLTVRNVGPAPLHVSNASITGTNRGQFAITANGCTGVAVAAGAACAITVRYRPTTAGTHVAQLTVVDEVAQKVGIGTGQDILLTAIAERGPVAFLEGEDDDSMVGGDHDPLIRVQVVGNRQSIVINGNDGVDGWSVIIEPRRGTTFAGGAAVWPTKRYAQQDATHAGLSLLRNERLCVTATGVLSVEQMTFNANNTLKTLVARWEYHCNGEEAASFGGIRFGVTSPFAVTELTDHTHWGQVVTNTLSTPAPVVFTNNGSGPAAVGQLAIRGTEAAQFQVVTDGCSNRTIAAGGSCTTTVRFRPSGSIGGKVAELVVPHTGALLGKGGHGQVVQLRGSSTVAASSNFGELTTVAPARLLDTASGVGAARAPLGPQRSVVVQVTGRGGVPTTGVNAVLVNITTRRSTSNASALTVWAAGRPRPGTSNVLPRVGATVTNFATVTLGTGGGIQVFNQAGNTDVAVDVIGWYSSSTGPNGARYHTLSPKRIVSTTQGLAVPKQPLAARTSVGVDLRGKGGIPAAGAVAIAINVTASSATAAGTVTAYAGDGKLPPLPTVAFGAGAPGTNLAVVRMPATGVIRFFSTAASTNLTIDVVGYWTAAADGNTGRYVPVTPARQFDTRKGIGAQPAGSQYVYQLGGSNGMAFDAGAAVMNVVAVQPTAAGHLRIYSDQLCAIPAATSVSFTAGRSVAGGAISSLSGNRPCAVLPASIDVYNSAGNTHLLIEVSGYFTP
ncbi:MAG: choice-of-anchor D domain-containing protein [Ilumatobacteraceae bacterium]